MSKSLWEVDMPRICHGKQDWDLYSHAQEYVRSQCCFFFLTHWRNTDQGSILWLSFSSWNMSTFKSTIERNTCCSRSFCDSCLCWRDLSQVFQVFPCGATSLTCIRADSRLTCLGFHSCKFLFKSVSPWWVKIEMYFMDQLSFSQNRCRQNTLSVKI